MMTDRRDSNGPFATEFAMPFTLGQLPDHADPEERVLRAPSAWTSLHSMQPIALSRSSSCCARHQRRHVSSMRPLTKRIYSDKHLPRPLWLLVWRDEASVRCPQRRPLAHQLHSQSARLMRHGIRGSSHVFRQTACVRVANGTAWAHMLTKTTDGLGWLVHGTCLRWPLHS
jgi:hypothetical protein